jgi:hypothetical protein
MSVRRPAIAIAIVIALAVAGSAAADEAVVSETLRVSPGAGDTFRWPYYLHIPADALDAARAGHAPALLVVPNNTGFVDDDFAVHDKAARGLCGGWQRTLAERLGVPLLVPAFPRPAKQALMYTHALDRDTLLTRDPSLRRLDLQLVAMIDDARTRLAARHLPIRARVLLDGYSASGMFVSRFVALHPTAVLAAAIGSPGGWPLAPVPALDGTPLRYPLGVADLAAVAGAPFDRDAWRRVRLLLYLGDRDDNDSVPNDDSYDEPDRETAMTRLGPTPVARWPVAEKLYRAAGCACDFKLHPGVDHKPSQQMRDDVTAFFRRALAE